MITRRKLLIALGAGVLSAPICVFAQQPKIWRIGFLTPRSRPTPPDHDAFSDAFIQGLSELGYSEGKNLVVEWRYAEGDYKRLADFAAELIRMDLPVIVTYGTASAKILKGMTQTTPIVVAAAVDLVGAGIVASLARPGGNITGLSVIDVDISAKQLELLKAVSPTLARVAVLLNPGNPADPAVLKRVEAAAPGFGVEVIAVNAATPQAIENSFAAASQAGSSAVIIAADAFFSGQGPQLAASALTHRLATIGIYQDHVLAGCLLSYGQNVAEYHRQAARYVDKILKGAKPEDLPVERPTKIGLVINSKTAGRLGLTIPQELLMFADRVIE
jgi:putative tryptophan/tyrosine transport system substrate-binding protein